MHAYISVHTWPQSRVAGPSRSALRGKNGDVRRRGERFLGRERLEKEKGLAGWGRVHEGTCQLSPVWPERSKCTQIFLQEGQPQYYGVLFLLVLVNTRHWLFFVFDLFNHSKSIELVWSLVLVHLDRERAYWIGDKMLFTSPHPAGYYPIPIHL